MSEMTNKYEVIFSKESENALIRITEGKFKDFVYHYNEVSIGEEESDGGLPIKFSYDLKEAPETYEYVDEDKEKNEFESVISDILYDIVVNSSKVKEVDGNHDTKQSDEG